MASRLAEFKYTCPCCGNEERGLPALAFDRPLNLPPPGLLSRLLLGRAKDDLYVDRRTGDRFVRCTMSFPIHDHEETLEWGVWASLSGRNFNRYKRSFASGKQSSLGPMFGWLSSRLPGYPSIQNVKCTVHPRDGGLRPWLEIEHTDHPLAGDFHHGVEVERAIELAGPWIAKMNR